VFLDANVLVSAFATRGLSAELLELVLLEHRLICVSIDVLGSMPIVTRSSSGSY
jgi:hypothetical protein